MPKKALPMRCQPSSRRTGHRGGGSSRMDSKKTTEVRARLSRSLTPRSWPVRSRKRTGPARSSVAKLVEQVAVGLGVEVLGEPAHDVDDGLDVVERLE